ncbi:MAG: threonine synthase [Ignisphaera sp.]|uniref:Threonine synthase n=1 Tax=Ignisphaera aggregans TaxID=334771 RepID=A0A7J3MWS9_9CREN
MYRVVKEEVFLRCTKCGHEYAPLPRLFMCPKCGSLLDVVINNVKFEWNKAKIRRFGVWRYRELLPIRDDVEPVTMCEGGTPLIKALNLYERKHVAIPNTYIKFEGANPTGSFKDRGMTVGVTIAKYVNVDGVVVASTGNTAASAAAYAARAGLRCIVVLPKGSVAKGKIAQALLHGAEIKEVEGSFDNALEEVFESIADGEFKNMYPLNSYNPWRLEGQKTIAYEIVDELGKVPDYVIVPVGNAGNISAIWKGFKELYSFGYIDKLPKMIGVQAEGAAPLASAWRERLSEPLYVDKPNTIASAIRIGRPINWPKAFKAVKESHGFFIDVSDEEIINAMKLLARVEGLGVEPASAASLAGLMKCEKEGGIDRDSLVVLIATGHALKDPDTIIGKIVV